MAASVGPGVKAAQLARQDAQRWAAAAGEASVGALQAALAAAERAKAELVTAHMGYLRKLAMQFSRQVCCREWKPESLPETLQGSGRRVHVLYCCRSGRAVRKRCVAVCQALS